VGRRNAASGKAGLLYGFYLNELLVRFVLRDEPSSFLFDEYVSTLNQLAHAEPAHIVLRKFEINLLRTLGLLGNLIFCSDTKLDVEGSSEYMMDPQAGVVSVNKLMNFPVVSGKLCWICMWVTTLMRRLKCRVRY